MKSSYSNGQGAECVEWAPEHAALTGQVSSATSPARASRSPPRVSTGSR
ncbi:DUF397 domain-containing protein [Streptomyces albidoflavus]